MNEYGRITRIVLKHPRDAFVDRARIESQWRDLRFTAAPDLNEACREYDAFAGIIASTGAAIDYLPADERTTLDSIYVRDASIASSQGLILCAMGKPQRAAEPDAMDGACTRLGLRVVGRIVPPGRIEGGDVVWLDAGTLVVGRGYRTNDAGIEQLRAIVGRTVEVVVVPLPHWTGQGDVMHLMSLISPVDADLAVVYSRLLPVPFRDWLLTREITLVEVPDDEFEHHGRERARARPASLRHHQRQSDHPGGARTGRCDGHRVLRRRDQCQGRRRAHVSHETRIASRILRQQS